MYHLYINLDKEKTHFVNFATFISGRSKKILKKKKKKKRAKKDQKKIKKIHKKFINNKIKKPTNLQSFPSFSIVISSFPIANIIKSLP